MTCIGFALGLFVATCTSNQAPQINAARLCAVMAAPIRYSRTDTPETRRQLRSLNASWRAACGGAR